MTLAHGPFRVVPVRWCVTCGQCMPADHTFHLGWPDMTYGSPGDMPDTP